MSRPVYAYIGRSIVRVIQSGTIWVGEKEEILARPEVARAVAKYPMIQRLIVPSAEMAAARKKVKQEGTLYHRWNEELRKQINQKGTDRT